MKCLSNRRRKAFALILCCMLVFSSVTAAHADLSGLESTEANLMSFLNIVSKIVGSVVLLLGIWQFALALRENDPSRRSQSILELIAGILILFSLDILNAIIG